MKLNSKLAVLAVALFCAAACDSAPREQGKPFDELPVLSKSDVLAFFKALPAADLPAQLESAEARESYYKRFRDMSEFGMLADGEGPEEAIQKTDNAIFWSEFLEDPENCGFGETSEDAAHPYCNIYIYSGTEQGRQFGIVRTGAYLSEGEQTNPDKCYWFDAASGKLTPAELKLEPAYSADDLTSDVLLTYGSTNLFYAVKEGKFHNNFYDRGMDVIIPDVGKTAVIYAWNGVDFVRDPSAKVYCIYNYAFAGFMLGEKVPWSVPGYSTVTIEVPDEYSYRYDLVREGASEPTLVFMADASGNIISIDVCSGPYKNPYGIYPGMPVADFMAVVEKVNARMPEPTYTSYNEGNEFVEIYTGFDEDFVYKVPRSQYQGNEKFATDATVARVVVINSAG